MDNKVIIDISSTQLTCEEMLSKLESDEGPKRTGIIFESTIKSNTLQVFDREIIQAILTLTGVGIGTLLKGLFDLATNKIVVEVSNGKKKTKIEIPRSYSLKKTQNLVELIKKSTTTRIKLDAN